METFHGENDFSLTVRCLQGMRSEFCFVSVFWCFRILCRRALRVLLSLVTVWGRNFKKIEESSTFGRGNNTDDHFKYSVLRNCTTNMVSVNAEVSLVLFHIDTLHFLSCVIQNLLFLT